MRPVDTSAPANLQPSTGLDATAIARWAWADTDRAVDYWERSPYGQEVMAAWLAAGADPDEIFGLTLTHLTQCIMSVYFTPRIALFDDAVRRAPGMLGIYRAAQTRHEAWRASNLARSADRPDFSNNGETAASSVPLQ